MVIERFRPGQAPEVYRRFRERGRMAPDNLRYLASWVDLQFERCYQVMEADNVEALRPWTDSWEDLVDFEIIPVRTSAEAAAIAAQIGPAQEQSDQGATAKQLDGVASMRGRRPEETGGGPATG